MSLYYLGIDVGSTTVKAVLQKEENGNIENIWRRYERHESKQAEKLLEYLEELEGEHPEVMFPGSDKIRLTITGSGGMGLAEAIGASYYQEVLAVSNAVEKGYPNVSSVVELGGQDAKILVFKPQENSDRPKKIMTMNDKCAGGTGAVIDKIAGKLLLNPSQLSELHYNPEKVHPVAGKCGVFAETDINSLQKQGVNSSELMMSLFDALVQQNLSVLTRGNTLEPEVILLGGPNAFLPALREAWRYNLSKIWQERNIQTDGRPLEELVFTPQDGEFFAAVGSIHLGREEHVSTRFAPYAGSASLQSLIEKRRTMILESKDGVDDSEIRNFIKKYIPQSWEPPQFQNGEKIRVYLGLDGGSTSTKGVFISEEGELVATDYRLSRGNPIEDCIKIIQNLFLKVEESGAEVEVAGCATTGYAKSLLKEVFQADEEVVETVAHTLAAQHYYNDIDVIVDVGGQDIKLLHLKDGKVVDFKLNTQCSAGNGYFLQNTAEGFGYTVDQYAEIAFSATKSPRFGYGCAVFLQTDIVDFQRQGWEAPEILAALADVLPRNIWQYVAQIPNPSVLGNRFVLQGGTQKNIAAVKAQVDYIHSKFSGAGDEPEVIVHKHTNVCGAIGAALEARKRSNGKTSFIGMEMTETLDYKSTYDESTRCYACKNKCLRTFIDINDKAGGPPRRFIIATCEKGEVEGAAALREVREKTSQNKKENPDLTAVAAKRVWNSQKSHVERVKRTFIAKEKKKAKRHEKQAKERQNIRIGIPRVLNHYGLQPFFTAYFQFLGIDYKNLVFSDFTTEKMYKEGSKRGTVDPCFPSKITLSHVHDLLSKHEKTKLDYLFFPMIASYDSGVVKALDNRACPTAVGATEMAYSAFTKERDIFTERGVKFLKPIVYMDQIGPLEKCMYNTFAKELDLNRTENHYATKAGWVALQRYKKNLEREAFQIIRKVEEEKRVAIVLLGRSYHHDEGINHTILEQFQKRGYPVLTASMLPKDPKYLSTIFNMPGDENVHPLEIEDVWRNSYSSASSQKVWGAKFVSRHPHLIPVELSSFKCGHDATLYSVVERIMEKVKAPFFAFKDIDENNPAGSIKIRVETIDYFLRDYIDRLRTPQPARVEAPVSSK